MESMLPIFDFTDSFDGHAVIANISGMADNDGGFAVLDKADNLFGMFFLDIEEDLLSDSEQDHTEEQVAYIQLK